MNANRAIGRIAAVVAGMGLGGCAYPAGGGARCVDGEGCSNEERPSAAEPILGETAAPSEVIIFERFDAAPSPLQVVKGGSWSIGGGRLTLTDPATAATANGNLAIHPTPVPEKFRLTATVRSTGTASAWNDLSVIFAYADEDNYAYASFNESNDGGTSGLFAVVDGVAAEIVDIPNSLFADVDHSVQIDQSGGSVEVRLDGELVASATSAVFGAGKVGFGTRNDGASFDDLKVATAPVDPPVDPDTNPNGGGNTLSWSPPVLTSPTTIKVTNSNCNLMLDTGRDYRILLPGALGNDAQAAPLQAEGGLSANGGRNVTLIGGIIRHDVDYVAAGSSQPRGKAMRAIDLVGWAGTLHLEGILVGGSHLYEAIDVSSDQPSAKLVVQNVRIGDPILYAVDSSGKHDGGDALKTSSGPAQGIFIDRFTIKESSYQGLFLQPQQFGPAPAQTVIKHFDIHPYTGPAAPGNGAYFFWQATRFPVALSDCWTEPNPELALCKTLWPDSDNSTSGCVESSDSSGPFATFRSGSMITGQFRKGLPPQGPFVEASAVGAGYESPGYADGAPGGDSCGDGTCGAGESCSGCPADCGACGPGVSPDVIAAVMSDIHAGSSGSQSAVAKLVKSMGASRILIAGDLTDGGKTSEFSGQFESLYGSIKSALFTAPGNHDYATSSASGYAQYFGAQAGSAGKLWHSTDLGNWHIVSLNSNVSMAAGKAQITWLDSDLKAAAGKHVIALWHHPRCSSGQFGDDSRSSAIWNRLMGSKAEIVISGHDHSYQRYARMDGSCGADASGPMEFIVATGGHAPSRWSKARPATELYRQNNDNGALKLTLGASSFAWEFHTVGGKVIDPGQQSCH
jgi:hypothetical protein